MLNEPVSLNGIKLMRAFTARLADLPVHCRVSRRSFSSWSAQLARTGVTEAQMTEVGYWYVAHHRSSPPLPYILNAVRHLLNTGTLPSHRLATDTELDAMAILQATERLGVPPPRNAQALMLAGALSHAAHFARSMPGVNRSHVRAKLERTARHSDHLADEILNEIATGRGELQALAGYLFGHSPQADGSDDTDPPS